MEDRENQGFQTSDTGSWTSMSEAYLERNEESLYKVERQEGPKVIAKA